MTTTTTEAKWLPSGYTIVAIAVAVAAVAIIAISQWLATDAVQSGSAQEHASIAAAPETAASSVSTNGLVLALNAGKFDAGLNSNVVPSAASSAVAARPVTVTVNGQGGLYAALIAGKFATDFGPQVQYSSEVDEGVAVSGLVTALNAGKFEETTVASGSTVDSSASATRMLTVSGGHHE